MVVDAFSRRQASATAGPVPDSRSGSYDGVETSARIAPVDGSRAATAPRRPRSPSYAARCIDALTVVTTSPPGWRPRVNSFQKGSGASSGSVPESTSSSAFSSSVVPYVCEA